MADFPPEADTQIECRACGGRFQLAGYTCRWCTQGRMSTAQLLYWRDHKSGVRPAVTGPTGAKE